MLKTSFSLLGCLGIGMGITGVVWRGAAAEIQATPPAGTVLARALLSNNQQTYAGSNYVWLNDSDIQFVINTAPSAEHVFGLLWGSKNDQRFAILRINGQDLALQAGGYDGFRWLCVPAPKTISGDKYTVVIQADAVGRPAFLSEVRLISTAKSAPAPVDIQLTLRPASKTSAQPAFPEMRALWDRDLAAPAALPDSDQVWFKRAGRHAGQAAEALYRSRKFVAGWLDQYSDPKTGLFPRNLREGRDLWNAKDCAADNYPFMVLTCFLTDRPQFEGRMLEMLRTETRLTSRIDRLPDDYLFSKQGFATAQPNLEAIIFGGAEYVKDGLIPLTEWLGPSPWAERMIGIMDDLWKHAPIDTPFGKIPTFNFEVNGDLLQACARLFWFTGERKYLDWGIRLGDYYLLGTNHPTRDLKQLRLSDHGCEVVNGLTELYVAVTQARPEKKRAYREPLHKMFDDILALGRNDDGLLYAWFNPQTGDHSKELCDTWGYNFDGFYTVYLVDKTEAYRAAVRKALGNLKDKYVGAAWADKSADGFADSIEGAINLYNREPVESAADWIDSQIRMMWAIQKPDGIIEGWHGDGNGARTSIMYALWKSQGVTLQPWREDVRLGAARAGDTLHVAVAAEKPWTGKLIFDQPRHRTIMRLPLDYPRINQFPEWFVVTAEKKYLIRMSGGKPAEYSGQAMAEGIPVRLAAGETVSLSVRLTQ